jgi:hypothetical protein
MKMICIYVFHFKNKTKRKTMQGCAGINVIWKGGRSQCGGCTRNGSNSGNRKGANGHPEGVMELEE